VRACPDGRLLFEGPYETPSLPDFLAATAQSRVILETAAEAFRIADAAKSAGHEVRVVPATLCGPWEWARARPRPTGAMLGCSARSLPDRPPLGAHPSARSREWKTICGMHDALITARTS